MEIANVFSVACDDVMEHEGFRIRETGIGHRIGAELIGGSVYEVDPGKKLWPYHLHHANEEWMVVLRGRPTLRTPEGERELGPGDCTVFRRGPAGAHLLRNDDADSARLLLVSTLGDPDVAVYLDSGKIGVWAGHSLGDVEELSLMVREASPDARRDYWEGESDWTPPEA